MFEENALSAIRHHLCDPLVVSEQGRHVSAEALTRRVMRDFHFRAFFELMPAVVKLPSGHGPVLWINHLQPWPKVFGQSLGEMVGRLFHLPSREDQPVRIAANFRAIHCIFELFAIVEVGH